MPIKILQEKAPVAQPTMISSPIDMSPVSVPTTSYADYARASSQLERKRREDISLFAKVKVSSFNLCLPMKLNYIVNLYCF